MLALALPVPMILVLHARQELIGHGAVHDAVVERERDRQDCAWRRFAVDPDGLDGAATEAEDGDLGIVDGRYQRGPADRPDIGDGEGPAAELGDLQLALTGAAGEVLDTASPALGGLRRAVRVAHERLRNRLEALVRSDVASALQEPIITLRNGRYVVPVKAEARSRVKGIVHDQSGSGQTIFVEPLIAVEMSNAWREAELAAQAEEERVLDELSANVAADADALVLMTEWKQYWAPDFDRLQREMKQPVIVDARNIWSPAAARRRGFRYYAIGRP